MHTGASFSSPFIIRAEDVRGRLIETFKDNNPVSWKSVQSNTYSDFQLLSTSPPLGQTVPAQGRRVLRQAEGA